jgi:hypothetical protein
LAWLCTTARFSSAPSTAPSRTTISTTTASRVSSGLSEVRSVERRSGSIGKMQQLA